MITTTNSYFKNASHSSWHTPGLAVIHLNHLASFSYSIDNNYTPMPRNGNNNIMPMVWLKVYLFVSLILVVSQYKKSRNIEIYL